MAQGSDQGRDDQAEDERQGNRLEDGSASIQQAEDATCADYGWHFQARAGGWVRHGRDEGRLIVAKLYHNDACVIIFVGLPCWMADQLCGSTMQIAPSTSAGVARCFLGFAVLAILK